VRHAVGQVEKERIRPLLADKVQGLGRISFYQLRLVGVNLQRICIAHQAEVAVALVRQHIVAVRQAKKLVEAMLLGHGFREVAQVPFADHRRGVAGGL
jgi:hypothetical protein